jgi:two-component system nitrate/nitrite response regulator NarP
MEAILRDNGLEVVTRDSDAKGAWSCEGIPPVDLLVLAWRYVSRSHGAAFAWPFNGQYQGKIVLVLEPDDEFTAEDFVAFDVEGLILSSASAEDFDECITSISRGSRWVDPAVRLLLGHSQHMAPHWENLSGREQEVARLAAAGLSNKHIARELDLSDGTVKMHMHHILAKLRLASRIELTQSLVEHRHAPQANGHSALASVEGQSGAARLIRRAGVALAGGYISAITIADTFGSFLTIYPT